MIASLIQCEANYALLLRGTTGLAHSVIAPVAVMRRRSRLRLVSRIGSSGSHIPAKYASDSPNVRNGPAKVLLYLREPTLVLTEYTTASEASSAPIVKEKFIRSSAVAGPRTACAHPAFTKCRPPRFSGRRVRVLKRRQLQMLKCAAASDRRIEPQSAPICFIRRVPSIALF